MSVVPIIIGLFVFAFISYGFYLINRVYRDIEELEKNIREGKDKNIWNKLYLMFV